jgi:hypothetical protein
MPDPLSNLEIQDVLSSIRRLVSEDRKTREIRQLDPDDAREPGGKLLLTEALRVETAPDSDDSEETEPEESAIAATPEEACEAAQDAEWDVALAAGVAATSAPRSIRPASVLEEDIASLETTIAELEAAVAGIGQDFEPDGSEVRKSAGDLDKQALDDAFDDGFAVDLGGPSRFEPDDASLSQPVTGDAMGAAGRDKAPQPPVAGEGEDASEETEATPDEVAFIRQEPVFRRTDLQVISGGEGLGAAVSAIRSGRLHLRPANGAGEDDGATGEEAVDLAFADRAADSQTAGDTAQPLDDDIAVPHQETEEFDAAEAEAEAVEVLADTSRFEVGEPLAAENATFDDAEELLSDMPSAPGVPPADAVVSAVLDAEIEPFDVAAPPLSAPPHPTGLVAEDDIGLFAVDDAAVIDMDALRDLIAEVIREELNGPLGERITRNVRKLVRQEIARALEAQKFD